MRKYLLLALILSANYFSGFTQTSSQTRMATFLNNLNKLRDVFGEQNYARASAEDLAADDGIHGCSSRLRGVKDSASFSNSFSSLALQGVGFTIQRNTVDGRTIRYHD